MHRYEKLEKIYYRKKFFKYLMFFVIFILSILLILKIIKNYDIKHNNNSYKKNNDINITASLVKPVKFNNKEKEKNISVKKNEKLRKLKNKNVKRDFNKTNYLPTLSFVLPKIETNTTEKVKKETNIKSNSQKKVVSKVKEKIKPKPIIIEENIKIDDLIKSFNKNPSFELAIQISEYYLNKNQLDLSKLWALKANNINPARYESWRLFAIILLKKNKKDKAKEVLQTYLNDYGQNENIQKLLRSIDE